MQDVCSFHEGICFSVAYATELLGVISILCDDQDAICDAGVERCNAAYREDVLRHFSGWKGSEITRLLERLSDEYNFNYDAPVELVVRRGCCAPIDREALCLHRKLIPPELFGCFLMLLDQFEEDSGFAGFYEDHREMYRQAISHFIADYDMYAPLPDYSCSAIYWTTLIVHEFAHAFVNPVTALHREQIAGIGLREYRQLLKEMMYGQSLETYINETVIRAMECIYVGRYFPAQHEAYVQEYEQDGFGKIRQVEEVLRKAGTPYGDRAAEIIGLF